MGAPVINDQSRALGVQDVVLVMREEVVSSDFKADEVEIGYCNVENPRFRKLAENEIENVLNDLADKQ